MARNIVWHVLVHCCYIWKSLRSLWSLYRKFQRIYAYKTCWKG